jgi:hypothetical protein
MDAFADVVASRGVGEGAVAGAIAFVIVLTIAWLTRRRRVPGAGLAFVVSATVALAGFGPFHGAGEVPGGLYAGLALLVAGGLLLIGERRPLWTALLAYAPGAIVIGFASDLPDDGNLGWVPIAITVAVAVGGALAFDADRARMRSGLGPVLLAISIAAIYSTVPDTERTLILLGAAIPLLAYAIPTPIAALGAEGAGAAIGLVMWVAASDGAGRPGSIVGVIGCLGLLVAEPIARRLPLKGFDERGRQPSPRTQHWQYLALFGAIQIALTLYAARIAGTERTPLHALALLLPAALASVLVATGLPAPVRRSRRPSRRPSRRYATR